jgi:peptidoglycan/LPS O-acetylase OafA/YrhL
MEKSTEGQVQRETQLKQELRIRADLKADFKTKFLRPVAQIPSLTPLRGIAALIVAIYHFSDLLVSFVSESTTHLISKGYLMVDLFFIMSGFIMIHVYQSTFQQGVSKTSFRKFIVSRLARIYPMHLFSLGIIVGFFLLTGAETTAILDPAALPSNLLLVHSFGLQDSYTWNVPSWSISAEFWCYMLFPFIMMFLERKPKLAISLFFFGSLLIYISIVYFFPKENALGIENTLNLTYKYGFLRGLAGFVGGILTYKVFDSGLHKILFKTDALLGVLILGAGGCMHFNFPDLFCIPLFAAITLCLATNQGLFAQLLQNRFLQWLGEISYSIYMLNIITIFMLIEFLNLIEFKISQAPLSQVSFLPGILGCLGFIFLVIIFSSLSFRFIEDPCRDFLKRKLNTYFNNLESRSK